MSMNITILQSLTGVSQSKKERREEYDFLNRGQSICTRWVHDGPGYKFH